MGTILLLLLWLPLSIYYCRCSQPHQRSRFYHCRWKYCLDICHYLCYFIFPLLVLIKSRKWLLLSFPLLHSIALFVLLLLRLLSIIACPFNRFNQSSLLSVFVLISLSLSFFAFVFCHSCCYSSYCYYSRCYYIWCISLYCYHYYTQCCRFFL